MTINSQISNVFVVGIGGGSASGKTTLATQVVSSLGEAALHFTLDGYYRELAHLDIAARNLCNFDAPDAFDWSLLLEHLDLLIAGEAVSVPEYDFATHLRRDERTYVEPKPILIVEGIHALSHPPLMDRFNLKVYVDAPADICLIRRLERDIAERGRDAASVIRQYQDQVRPMFLEYIAPARANADLVVSGEDCERGVAIVTDAISARI